MATDFTVRCANGHVIQVGTRVLPWSTPEGLTVDGVPIISSIPGGVVVQITEPEDCYPRVRVGYDDGLHDDYPAFPSGPDACWYVCDEIETGG